MNNKIEGLIKAVYRRWKAGQSHLAGEHPDEETIASFLEDKLPEEEANQLKFHLVSCQDCSEALAIHLQVLKRREGAKPAEDLLAQVKALAKQVSGGILEIILKLKEKALEIISTSGDVLVGQELVPAPVLRSRKIRDFKDEVTILKDFQDIRIEAKIENKQGRSFNLTVLAKEKSTSRILKDLRITLIKEGTELASYVADLGAVTFENVLLGRYSVEIAGLDKKLATVLLEIKS